MAGFSSLDDLISEMTVNGKTQDFWFQKITSNGATGAAGRWYELFTGTGFPAAGTFSGTAGTAVQMASSTTGAMPLNAAVSTDTRHLLNATVWSPTATVPVANLILCDFLLYYPAIVVTGTPTTLTNGVSLPRYTDGIGVQAFCAVQSAFGAASPALTFTFTSTNSAGSTTGSRTAVMTAAANSAPISNILPNAGSQFFPIPSGDVGVVSVQSYTLASGTTGTAAIVLCKPLMQIPITQQYLASERETLFQLAALPRIYDNACLGWLLQPGGAMVTSSLVQGRCQYAWG
jgi:hypothetical protein